MKNKVELLGYYGGDKEHAMSAWTSTTRDYEKVLQLQEELPIDNVQEEHKGIPKTKQ